ncbi:hypothetical protein CsatB_019764 [Cannabis sativa]
MYVTKALSLLRRCPELVSSAPNEGPSSGYLVLFDQECETTTCFGLCKETSIEGLPFPQNKDLSVTHTTSNGNNNSSQTSYDQVVFIPVLDQPLSSNRYYVIRRQGTHKGYSLKAFFELTSWKYTVVAVQGFNPSVNRPRPRLRSLLPKFLNGPHSSFSSFLSSMDPSQVSELFQDAVQIESNDITFSLNPGEVDEPQESNQVLVGKILSRHKLGKAAIQGSLRLSWNAIKGWKWKEIEDGLIQFTFANRNDAMNVLARRPWFVCGSLIVIMPWPSWLTPSEIRFDKTPMWVKVDSIPPFYWNLSNLKELASRASPVYELPQGIEDAVGVSNLSEASASSTEDDMGTCCCCTYIKDVKSRPLDPSDVLQQVEIIQKNPRGRFTAESVAENGFPPTFLRRKWNLYMETPRHYQLHEAPGLNSSLRSQLPDLKILSKTVVVGKWYCPFMFVKELGGLKLKQQMKNSMFYEMTLEQRWDKVFECDNVGNSMKMVSVDVFVNNEEACVNGKEAMCEWGHVDDGVIWFRSSTEGDKGEEQSGRLLGLSKLIMDRIKWEEQRVGFSVDEIKGQVKVKRTEKFDGKEWSKFSCYVLVERFVLKRVDGTVLLTLDFKHTNQIRCKWE